MSLRATPGLQLANAFGVNCIEQTVPLLILPPKDKIGAMRIIEIVIGITLLGGAAWTTVRTYKGRGMSSVFVLAFAVFLVALGLSFLFGAFGELVRNLRFGSEWLK